MNGPVESYRMNEPMTWEKFKELPDDLKVTYIKTLREKYKINDSALAEAMGVDRTVFSRYMKCYGLSLGSAAGRAGRNWYRTPERDQFVAWWNGVKLENVNSDSENTEQTVKEAEAKAYCDNDVITTEAACNAIQNELFAEPVEVVLTTVTAADVKKPAPKKKNEKAERCGETRCAVPTNGCMTFEGNIDDILRSVSTLLDGRRVHIKVEWDLLEE